MYTIGWSIHYMRAPKIYKNGLSKDILGNLSSLPLNFQLHTHPTPPETYTDTDTLPTPARTSSLHDQSPCAPHKPWTNGLKSHNTHYTSRENKPHCIHCTRCSWFLITTFIPSSAATQSPTSEIQLQNEIPQIQFQIHGSETNLLSPLISSCTRIRHHQKHRH